MSLWLILAIACVSCWGVWGFVAKFATTQGVPPLALGAVSSLASVLTTWGAFYFIEGPQWEKSNTNISLALITGFLGSAGAITFFLALQHGRASLVVPLSALCPGITIFLSFIILNEHPSPTQMLGIALALIASILLGL